MADVKNDLSRAVCFERLRNEKKAEPLARIQQPIQIRRRKGEKCELKEIL